MGYEQFHVSNSHPGYLVTIPFMFDIPRIAQVSRRLIMKYVFSKDERCALSDNSSWDKYTRCLQKYRVPSMYPIFKRANRFIDFNSNENGMIPSLPDRFILILFRSKIVRS